MVLSSGKIDKYEYLPSEEMFPSNQRQTIEQAKFVYSPLEKAFEKQTEKQASAIKSQELSNKTRINKLRVYFHKIWQII